MAGSSFTRILLIAALVVCVPLPILYAAGQNTIDISDDYDYAISVPCDERYQIHAARSLDIVAYFLLATSGIWKPEDGRQKKLSTHSAFVCTPPILAVNLRE